MGAHAFGIATRAGVTAPAPVPDTKMMTLEPLPASSRPVAIRYCETESPLLQALMECDAVPTPGWHVKVGKPTPKP